MTSSVRSFPTAGAVLLAAAAVTLTPAVAPLAERDSAAAVRLSAAVQPVLGSLVGTVQDALGDVGDVLAFGAAGSPALADLAVLNATGNFLAPVADFIKDGYTVLEQWVRYGFRVAEWAAGWVPVVGWFAPQIMIFYDLGESIVESLLFNTVDWISGQVGFLTGLSNIATEIGTAFTEFFHNQIGWILSFLPPFPPLAPLALSAAPLEALNLAALGLPEVLPGLLSPADLGLGALPGVAGDLAGHLGDLLLSLFS